MDVMAYEKLMSEFEARGLDTHKKRLEETIKRAEAKKLDSEVKKPRRKKDIQRSIDEALYLKHQFLVARKPTRAAIWDHRVKEYEKEFKEALLGRVYVPQIEA